MKVNVLYMIDALDYGGAEKQLVELIRNLNTKQYIPHLCCLKPSGSLYSTLEIPKITLPFNGFANWNLITAIRTLVSYIKEYDIRIVQTHFQDPFLLAAMSRPFCHTKLVGTFLDLGFWRTPWETLKMRFTYPFFNAFIANSQAVKKHFTDTDGIRPEKIRVIYNGFDFKQVAGLKRPEKSDGEFRIGIVANLNRPVKRVDDFIRAAKLVYSEFPRSRFVIAGDGHLKSDLQAQAVSLGIGADVEFLGRIPNPLDFIRNLDVGVICSESEGFSNAIIEYMACGVPVVVTNVGGNPELVTENENGFLFPVGDYITMSERICSVLRDKKLRRCMGNKNRSKIKQEFSVTGLARNHEAYYHYLLERL
ncbi:putative Glycosyl transferase, gt4A [Desulfosarcina cetonica]|uniref:glycosyltransferase n=1 Tax=Desulfosarcina cetonica TaxID=90730 RepID=UPI0006CF2AAB|nr:glycosyltransferase [Desulfosarcina cetonica]VTR64153.1 putative Glycosyl transferase, gt4A [Desulfosarcina cetonica]